MNPFFVVATFIGMLAPVVAPSNSPRTERRRFWAGFVIASISAFFIAYPPDVKTGSLLSLFTCSLMLIRAYFSTSYIKVRGKVYAFHIEDSRSDISSASAPSPGIDDVAHDPAPDAYGGLGRTTAKKMWWLVVFLVAFGALGIAEYFHFRDSPWSAVSAGVAVVTIATALGYMDASWEYPIGRTQRIQFGVASIVSLGVFTVFYLGAYYAGKRWPWRNKRSFEYRARVRRQNNWH